MYPRTSKLNTKKEIFDQVYIKDKSNINPQGTTPKTQTQVKEGSLKIPEFYDTVKTLAQTVDVDYFLPGCSPPVQLIAAAIDAIAATNCRQKAQYSHHSKQYTTNAPENVKTKESLKSTVFMRKTPEPENAFEQGIIFMGLATRSGCGAQCIKVDMPCTGCGG